MKDARDYDAITLLHTALFCSLLFIYIEHYFLFFGWNGGGSFWMTAKMIYDSSVSVDFADKRSLLPEDL